MPWLMIRSSLLHHIAHNQCSKLQDVWSMQEEDMLGFYCTFRPTFSSLICLCNSTALCTKVRIFRSFVLLCGQEWERNCYYRSSRWQQLLSGPTSSVLCQRKIISSNSCALVQRVCKRCTIAASVCVCTNFPPLNLYGRQISLSYSATSLSVFLSPHETMNTLRQICFHSLWIRDSQLCFAQVCAHTHICVSLYMCVCDR